MQTKLYPIKDSLFFRAGGVPDGTQLLLAPFGNEVIVLSFDSDGRFGGIKCHPLEIKSEDAAEQQVDRVIRSSGMRPGEIRVQKFTVAERGLGIRDTPDYLQEYADSPSSFPPERAIHLARALEQWKKKQGFVLVWGEDYEMDAQGDVEST
jgi:hypothetical protein